MKRVWINQEAEVFEMDYSNFPKVRLTAAHFSYEFFADSQSEYDKLLRLEGFQLVCDL